jgi:hypothetical protein
MLRATERGVGRAEPYCDAAIFSRDIMTFSGLYSQQFFPSKNFQQGISKGQRVS